MRKKNVHILLVEDSETDAELTIRQIHKIDPSIGVRVVDTLSEVEVAIGSHMPDMIISDYNLPSCTGMEVLRLAQDKIPNTVFIFLTGTLQDEELAAETILNGANGFILKKHINNLVNRLPPFLDKIEKKRSVEEQAKDQIASSTKLITDIRNYLNDVNAENLTYQERIKKMKDHLDTMKKSIE